MSEERYFLPVIHFFSRCCCFFFVSAIFYNEKINHTPFWLNENLNFYISLNYYYSLKSKILVGGMKENKEQNTKCDKIVKVWHTGLLMVVFGYAIIIRWFVSMSMLSIFFFYSYFGIVCPFKWTIIIIIIILIIEISF